MFNLTANGLFGLLQGIPGGTYRVARSIIALTMRAEGALAAECVAGKVLHGKAHADSSTHPNSPYET